MPAFVNGAILFRRRTERATARERRQFLSTKNFTTPVKRRRAPRACASPLHEDERGAATHHVTFDDMVSDDEYVVLDGKDIAKLVEELQRNGRDQLGIDSEDGDEGLSEDFLTLAEKRSDEWNGRSPQQTIQSDEGTTSNEVSPMEKEDEKRKVGMDYFVDDHVEYMPSWAADAYWSGEHHELEEASKRIESIAGEKRLHDIVARKKAVSGDRGYLKVGTDGIVDCTVQDVAEDYSVPTEFVVDAMIHYGVSLPIRADQSIRDSMTTEEIERLLHLITSFDAVDLSDRYSDRTIAEMADDYDLSAQTILEICQKEGLYVFSGESTRLSVVREDRVLDIILKGAATGQSYPSLLEGLEK